MKQFLIAGTALLALTACGQAADEVSLEEEIKTAPSAADVEAALPEAASRVITMEAAPVPADAITTESGLQYIVAQAGLENGASAATGQQIAAHYHGFFPNGEVFDSSYQRGRPLTGPSNGFIKGWNEALGDMKVCEARTLYITPDLAYGDADRGSIPGGSTLYFNMQLLAVDAPSTDDNVTQCPVEKVLQGPENY